jgi:hypothetical protein
MEQAAERVNVGAGIGRLTFSLLRRHVGRRADHHVAARYRFVLPRLCQSEIQNLNSGFRDHHVTRLEIAVNDAFTVCFSQCGRNLDAVMADHLIRFGALLQPLGDGFALHQFPHQVVGADIEQCADIGVIERRNRAPRARIGR